MRKNLTILYAPIHYVLDKKNSGSELSWSYKIYENISSNKTIDAVFITGGVRDITDSAIYNLSVFNPENLNLSLLYIFKFYLQIFLTGIKICQQKNIQIIHHVLPFRIGNTFNILGIFSRKKFIIGPIQPDLEVTDTDLDVSSARGFKKRSSSTKFLIDKFIIFFISPVISILSHYTLKKAAKIIVVNKMTQEVLAKKGVRKDKIVIIPPGIDVNTVPYKERIIKNDEVSLLVVSYLLKRKRVDLVLKALKEVIKTNSKVTLHIVGDGPQKEELHSIVDEYMLRKHVIFHGFIPQKEIYDYYEKADIFINMSKAEGFATICLEAMASGLAIVSSKVGGFSDAIIDGENGFLVEQEDYMELANKIHFLLSNKEYITKFSKNARKTVELKYDWESVIIPKYVTIYQNV